MEFEMCGMIFVVILWFFGLVVWVMFFLVGSLNMLFLVFFLVVVFGVVLGVG